MYKGRLLIVTVFAALLLGVAGAALAQTGGPVVQPRGEGRVDRVSPQVQERGALPFTGSDLVLFAIAGLGVIAVGSMIVARTRRQPQPR